VVVALDAMHFGQELLSFFSLLLIRYLVGKIESASYVQSTGTQTTNEKRNGEEKVSMK
jgi:hypothetical protein